jgi:hypothetical protein
MNPRSNRPITEGDLPDFQLARIRKFEEEKRERQHLLSCDLDPPRRRWTLYCAAAYDAKVKVGAWAAVALGNGEKTLRVGLSPSDSTENFRVLSAVQALHIFGSVKGINCVSEFDRVAQKLAKRPLLQSSPEGRLWKALYGLCAKLEAHWSIPCEWTHQGLSGLQAIAEDELRRMDRFFICEHLKLLGNKLYLP